MIARLHTCDHGNMALIDKNKHPTTISKENIMHNVIVDAWKSFEIKDPDVKKR